MKQPVPVLLLLDLPLGRGGRVLAVLESEGGHPVGRLGARGPRQDPSGEKYDSSLFTALK